MAFAARNAPELQENLKPSLGSVLPPPRPHLLLVLVGLPPQAGAVGHFRCMLQDKLVLIVNFGEICQNKYMM